MKTPEYFRFYSKKIYVDAIIDVNNKILVCRNGYDKTINLRMKKAVLEDWYDKRHKFKITKMTKDEVDQYLFLKFL